MNMERGNPINERQIIVQPVISELFNQHLNHTEVPTRTSIEILLRIVTAFFGSGWGIPWIAAASQAALIFPTEESREVFSKIFAAGIVITVGADGLWLMLEIGKFLGAKTQPEKTIFIKDETWENLLAKTILPPVLSVFSCIAPVYASVKYNSGPEKFLGVITFIGNFGESIYGYYRLIDALLTWRDLHKNASNYKIGIQNKKFILNNIEKILSKQLFPSNEEIFQSIFNTESFDIDSEFSRKESIFKKIVQILPTLLICTAFSLIGFFLTKEFFTTTISDSPALIYPFSIFAQAPVVVIAAISNYEFFGRSFDFVFGNDHDPQRNLIKEQYPKSSMVLPYLLFLISLLAPTAAGYILYNTFNEENVNSTLTWIATISIILVRVTFSNFTLTKLCGSGLTNTYAYYHEQDHELNRKNRLIEYKNTLSSVSPRFFQIAVNGDCGVGDVVVNSLMHDNFERRLSK